MLVSYSNNGVLYWWMEDKKTPKRSVRKLSRNIWLFSMLAFSIVLISFYLVGIIFKITQFSGIPQLVFMTLFGLIGLVGGISFLVWISILIFSNKPLRIIEIFIGIFVSSLYFLTTYSVAYIYIYSRVTQDSSWGLLDVTIPLLISGVVLFIWLRTKPIFVKAVVVVLLIVTYFLGRNYAIKAYEPLKQAFNYVNQAQSEEGLVWTKETNRDKFLEGERNYVDLYQKAANSITNDIFRSWGRNYFDSLYQLKKSTLENDEQFLTGKLVLTQEEMDKIVAETIAKRDSILNTGFVVPFWVTFFRVN